MMMSRAKEPEPLAEDHAGSARSPDRSAWRPVSTRSQTARPSSNTGASASATTNARRLGERLVLDMEGAFPRPRAAHRDHLREARRAPQQRRTSPQCCSLRRSASSRGVCVGSFISKLRQLRAIQVFATSSAEAPSSVGKGLMQTRSFIRQRNQRDGLA